MALLAMNLEPSPRDLRIFTGVLGLILGGVAIWCANAGHNSWALGLGVAAGVVILLGLWLPGARRLYQAWVLLFFPLGLMVSYVVLGVVYYMVITPVGLLRRAFAGDPMARKLDRDAETYWQDRDPAPPTSRYFRQF